jgi:hypothetical protein
MHTAHCTSLSLVFFFLTSVKKGYKSSVFFRVYDMIRFNAIMWHVNTSLLMSYFDKNW